MKVEILKEGFGFKKNSIVEATEANAEVMIKRGIAKKAADNAKLKVEHEAFNIEEAKEKKGLEDLEEKKK